MERWVASGEGTRSFLERRPVCFISQGENCSGCTEFYPQEGKAGRVCKMTICLSLMVSIISLYQDMKCSVSHQPCLDTIWRVFVYGHWFSEH